MLSAGERSEGTYELITVNPEPGAKFLISQNWVIREELTPREPLTDQAQAEFFDFTTESVCKPNEEAGWHMTYIEVSANKIVLEFLALDTREWEFYVGEPFIEGRLLRIIPTKTNWLIPILLACGLGLGIYFACK